MDFLGYKYIAQVVVLLEILVLLLAYRRNPRLAIYAILLSIALKGQYIWLGRAIYAWQFAALLGIVLLLKKNAFQPRIKPGRPLGAFHASMLLYFLYSIGVSLPMWVLFSVEGTFLSQNAVSITRIFTQTFYFLLLIGLYGFGRYAGKYLSAFNLIRALVVIGTVVAYFSIVQVLVVSSLGINLFPIIGSNDTVRSAYILGATFRATSFAGEPKHLGILMSVGLTAFYLARLFRVPLGGPYTFHVPVAMVTALLLSLSTTGIALTGVSIGVASVIFFKKLRKADVLLSGLIAASVLLFLLTTEANFATSLERQLLKTELEVQDQSVAKALFASPGLFLTGTGLGNVHLIAVDYLPDNFPLFRDGGYKANSGFFFVVGDSGLIGLLLLIAAPFFALQAYFKDCRALTIEQRKEASVLLAFTFILLLSFLLRYDVFYFLLSGFAYARLSMLRNNASRIGAGVEQRESLRKPMLSARNP